jgi:hypothetical protein
MTLGRDEIASMAVRDAREIVRFLDDAEEITADGDEGGVFLLALDSRVVIEQAKGILAGKLDISVDRAFDLIRQAARSSRRNIHDVSREVVELRTTPSGYR